MKTAPHGSSGAPIPLDALALDAFATLEAVGADDALLGEAPRVLAASRYLAALIVRRPVLLERALQAGSLLDDLGWTPQRVDSSAPSNGAAGGAADGAIGSDADSVDRHLRDVRHGAFLVILWRMLAERDSVEQTLTALSALADLCIGHAARSARARLATRFGVPRDTDGRELSLLVVAMGKLGGRELNVSSDIDLIFLHGGAGRTDGASPIDASDWFAREARAVAGSLSRITADGFVFRVDTRLRPFGASGPPVSSLDALEGYWRDHARDWERHAMVKARAVIGAPEDIERFEALRLPFVYRRYLDFNAVPSLRDLQRLIGERERVRGGDDVKLGHGGIRELEFLVQAFQLVRGGQVATLRQRGLLDTLQALVVERLIPGEQAGRLADAYRYLRRVENGLQALDDAQRHRLPAVDSEDFARLAVGLGEADAVACLARLDAHRDEVSSAFEALFDGEGIGVEDGPDEGTNSPAPDALPAASPTASPTALPDALAGLSDEPSIARLDLIARTRVETLAVAATACLHEQDAPHVAGKRLRTFLLAAAGRGGYLQVLLDRPGALRRLIAVFARSAWVADAFARQPMLVDEVLRPGVAELPDTPEGWRALVDARMKDVDADDLEAQMNACRRLRQVQELRVALAWLEGSLGIMQVSDRLSWLAEALVSAALACVGDPLVARHGRPRCTPEAGGPSREVATAVIAYGKLGGLELGHGSDLDLVFLHDSVGRDQRTDGDEPLDNTRWLARLVQKFTHFMSVRTEAGPLYEIDLRLRPNGSAGLLVTSVAAFAGYQRDEAWTWEHQALLRARAFHGDEDLCMRFERLRVEILCRERAANSLASSVADMRARMVSVHGTAPAGRMHLKRDPGGITDLEFVVQYLALAHAAAQPSIVRYSDNVRVLEAARDVDVIDAATHAEALATWLELRRTLYAAALDLAGSEVERDASIDALSARVIALRDRFLVPRPA